MTTEELQQKLQSELRNVEITERFKNIIISRDAAHVMVRLSGDEARLKTHTPLAWFLPGILLAMAVVPQFGLTGMKKVACFVAGTLLSSTLYSILKKREIERLKKDVGTVLEKI